MGIPMFCYISLTWILRASKRKIHPKGRHVSPVPVRDVVPTGLTRGHGMMRPFPGRKRG